MRYLGGMGMSTDMGRSWYRINDIMALKAFETGKLSADFKAGKLFNQTGREIKGHLTHKGYLAVKIYEG